jgi:hypothetical protein
MSMLNEKELKDARPETRFDARFEADLKRRFLAGLPAGRPSMFASFFETMKKTTYLIPAGAALVLLVALALNSNVVPGAPSREAASTAGVSIEQLDDRAFGLLALSTGLGAARPESGGGSGLGLRQDTAAVPAPSAAPLGLGAAGGDGKMIAPDSWPGAINYRYVYKGGPIASLDAQLAVLKRIKGSTVSAQNLGNLDIDLIDLSRLSDLKAGSYALVEDREFGYFINVDLNEGSVSINQNWAKWPHPEQSCRDEACFQQYRLKAEDVPADDAVIAIADAFLAEYGISKTGLGAPVVRSEWRIAYAQATDKSFVYIPDSVSVVYPQMIEGRPVVDDGGPSGLYVGVNVRHRRVDNVYGLTTQRYQSSLYDAETDEKRILGIVERGGVWGYTVEGAKTVEVEVGEPERVWTRSWLPDPSGNGQELLVPALRFPILNKPANEPYFRDSIVVPLIKDVLDQNSGGGGFPMPLIKEAETRVK